MTEGADAGLIGDLRAAAEQEQATVGFVAPVIGGVTAGDGSRVTAGQQAADFLSACRALRYRERQVA